MSRSAAERGVQVRRVAAEPGLGESYVRVNSVGAAGERPFVLVPGIGVASDYFEKLAPHLNEFGPVHALDLPGFGGVPHPNRALKITEFAALVGRAIDELELEDPILVGHSMGTQVVTEVAADRSGLSTVILISPVVNSAEREVLRQAFCFLRSAAHEPGRVKVLALRAYLVCGVRWFSRVLPEMMRHRIEDTIGAVHGSVLFIRGTLDANCPPDWVERLARRHPQNQVWEIEGAAHSVMYAHAAEVANLCVRFARDPGTDDDRLRRYPTAEDAGG